MKAAGESVELGNASTELRTRYEEQVEDLRAQCEAEQRSKEQLQQDLTALRSQESRCQTGMNLTAPQREVLARLQALQASMVGGELAHDQELKERRKRQLRVSERRLKALASALGRKDEEDAAVLQVYDDIEQEQDRNMKLFQQIIAKMIPALKQECNYSDVDKIKADATWNDDTQKWKVPDLIFSRTKLPPAGPSQLGGGHTPPQRGLIQPGGRAPSRTAPARIEPASPDKEKLERSEQENLAGNYFKPKRATELLIKAQEECSRKATQQWKVS
ncbi:hypothetical protein B566_EDAN007043 [Ephemera danica]|nr:hypothetical protein B566_EDAN007043 [Ephemera danica]